MKRIVLLFCVVYVVAGMFGIRVFASANDTMILNAASMVKIKKGDINITNVNEDGGGVISNLGGSSNDVENPVEALYYRFDLSGINRGIVSAHILQNAESKPYSTLAAIYDCPDNNLENGMNYQNVPKASFDNMITKFSITNLNNIDLTPFPGVTKNYNISIDVTEYVRQKADKQNGFTFMIYPKYDGSIYKMTSSPIIYLELGEENTDAPSAEFLSSETNYSDKGNFVEQIKASDANGIGDIEVYLGDYKVEGTFSNEEDIYTFTGAPLIYGQYKLKVIVKDIYGKSTTLSKYINVSMSHDIIDPTAAACTRWGDENQSGEKYAPEGRHSAYWIISSGTEGETNELDSDYWKKPTGAVYHKFDISKYIEDGYAIKKAYIIQNGSIGSGVFYEAKTNDLENGDNYLTAPEINPDGFISYFSMGNESSNYLSEEDRANKFPGARKGDNFAVDITDYVNKKITFGETSFTMIEYAHYTADIYSVGNFAQLYVELTDKPDISIIDTSASAFQKREFEVLAKAEHESGIEKVDFYLNNTLAASAVSETEGYYKAVISGFDAGNYTLKAAASAKDGGLYFAEKDFEIKRIYANISANDNNDEKVKISKEIYHEYTFDIPDGLDGEIEKVFYTQNSNSVSKVSTITISDTENFVNGTLTNALPLDGYYFGAPKNNCFNVDITDMVKNKILGKKSITLKLGTNDENVEYEFNSTPEIYVRYKTENSDIDRIYSKSVLDTECFSEVYAGDKVYLKINGLTTLSNFTSSLIDFNDCNVSAKRNGLDIDESKILSNGDEIYISDAYGNVLKEYTVMDSNYISDISISIVYGKCEANAYVDVGTENIDAKLCVAAYKNGALVGIGVGGYTIVNGASRLSATVTCEDADIFKAMLIKSDDLKPLQKTVSKKRQKIILKFDDFSVYTYPSYEKLRQILKEEGITGSIGIIVSPMDKSYAPVREDIKNYDVKWNIAKRLIDRCKADGIEFWHHGYLHNESTYSTKSYEEQLEDFKKGYDIMTNDLEIELASFGSPYNNSTDVTIRMIKENFPQIKVLMLVNGKYEIPNGMVNLNKSCQMETSSSKIESDMFIENFDMCKDKDYMVIQTHPCSWDTNSGYDSWSEFKKCIKYMKENGVVFMTPMQYYDYITK